MSKKNYLLGLVAGIAVVIISALLIILDKVSEARKKISHKISDAIDSFKDPLNGYEKKKPAETA